MLFFGGFWGVGVIIISRKVALNTKKTPRNFNRLDHVQNSWWLESKVLKVSTYATVLSSDSCERRVCRSLLRCEFQLCFELT